MVKLYERLTELCDNRGITPAQMCRDVAVGQNTMTELKSGRVKSLSSDKLAKLADYFGVSIDYLLGRVDKFGLSTDDWRTISGIFVSYLKNAGKNVSDLVDGRTVTFEQAEAFVRSGAPLEPIHLTFLCGMLGISAPDVFALYADNLWPEKPKKLSSEDKRELEKLRSSPATRALLHTISDMTEEQISSYDNFIRSLRGLDRKDD